MSDRPHDPTDAGWREALRELRTPNPPAPALEARVTASLAAQRVTRRKRIRLGAWLAAAALLAVTVGIFFFRPPTEGPRYLLLLYEGSRFDAGGQTHAQLAGEYGAWAGGLAGQGKLVDASALADEERLISGVGEPTRGAAGGISGFFIVRAASMEEAAAIAAGCPHLKYGGEVAVRPLRG